MSFTKTSWWACHPDALQRLTLEADQQRETFPRGEVLVPFSREQKIGVLYGLAAFGFWGFVPIYFKALQHVLPLEILGHRVIWSVPLTALMITLSRDWNALRLALYSRKVLGMLFVSSTLVASNMFVYIYAVNTDRVLQASLGYFINPLVNVLLGIMVLRERLRPLQALAVLFAAAGTINMTVNYGTTPWIALALASLFGIYGLLRKYGWY